MLKAAMLGALVLALASPVAAQTTECATLDKVREMSVAIAKGANGDVYEFSGEDATKFVKAYNALPPESEFAAQTIVIIASKERPTALMALVDKDQACGWMNPKVSDLVAAFRKAFAVKKEDLKDGI